MKEPDRRRHADRRHGGALRLRRRRVLHRRPDVEPQQPARSRRRSADATTSPRPSTSWSRSTRSSIAAPRSCFGVTRVGGPLDRVHATDSEETFDLTFDLVWRAAARQDADGWTAEIWIPLGAAPLQSGRRPHLGPQHPALPADAERAGHLGADPAHRAGLGLVVRRPARAHRPAPVTPPRGARPTSPAPPPAIPRRRPATRSPTGPTWSAASAPTSRWASGPNLTLEATINPDFGQVEADPAEVNLTAFETRFPERRPFFLEGAPLFNIGHPNFYYSRRIGARPVGAATGDYVDYPDRHHHPHRRQAERPAAVEDLDRLPGGGDRRGGGGGGLRADARDAGNRTLRRGPTTASGACCRSSARSARPPASSPAPCIATSTTAARWPTCTRERGGAGRQHAAALPRRRVRVPGRRRRVGGERHRGGDRAGAAVERALRAASRPHLFAARSDADVAGRHGPCS